MGDRGNIKIVNGDDQVCLYTHWDAMQLPTIVAECLAEFPRRWSDNPYLARIIFSRMIKDDIFSETGYGISSKVTDNEHDIIVLDCDNCELYLEPRPTEQEVIHFSEVTEEAIRKIWK